MKKGILIGSIVAVIVIIVVVAILMNGNSGNKIGSNLSITDSEKVQGGVEQAITLDLLGAHDSANDCWIGFRGKVYDITSYLPKHPGTSEAIAPYCGTADGFENAFMNKHGEPKAQYISQVGIYKGDL